MGERLPRVLGTDQFALLEEFAGAMARAIGTPLTVLMLAAEQAASAPAAPDASGPEGTVLLTQMYRLAQIQRSLLEAGQDPGPGVEIDVNQSLRRAVELAMEQRSVRHVLALDPRPIRTNGDPMLLQRAFLDLVDGAAPGLSHLEVRTRQDDGGVEIRIVMAPARVGLVPEWEERFTLWREDGSPGRLWRAWQFACRRRGYLELGGGDQPALMVTMRWPREDQQSNSAPTGN
jgi:hypothetical protein